MDYGHYEDSILGPHLLHLWKIDAFDHSTGLKKTVRALFVSKNIVELILRIIGSRISSLALLSVGRVVGQSVAISLKGGERVHFLDNMYCSASEKEKRERECVCVRERKKGSEKRKREREKEWVDIHVCVRVCVCKVYEWCMLACDTNGLSGGEAAILTTCIN